MSIEQAKAFLEKVKNDEDFAKSLAEAQGKASIEFARREGYEFSAYELNKCRSEVLSDEELRGAAGGVAATAMAGVGAAVTASAAVASVAICAGAGYGFYKLENYVDNDR